MNQHRFSFYSFLGGGGGVSHLWYAEVPGPGIKPHATAVTLPGPLTARPPGNSQHITLLSKVHSLFREGDFLSFYSIQFFKSFLAFVPPLGGPPHMMQFQCNFWGVGIWGANKILCMKTSIKKEV